MARICCGPLHTFAVLTSVGLLLILVHKDKKVTFAFSPSTEWRHSSNISYRRVQFQKNLCNNVNSSADQSLIRADCEGRGCCYLPLPQSGLRGTTPWCFYPVSYPGYKMGPLLPTEKGQRATLTRSAPSHLPRDIPTLQLDVMDETVGRLHLTFKDPASTRYEVPFMTSQSRDVEFQPDPFGFIVRRKSNGHVL
uniref:P-type domain-containing protein n=1 Tax=Sinocyclocheilus anshuiensis TaxID=1608454 RepID=A0A671NIE4_9TELE